MQERKMIFNPDYYGVNIHEEGEGEGSSSSFSKALMQLLFLVALFFALFFAYKIAERSNIVSWSSFLQERGEKQEKRDIKAREKIVIREEPMLISSSMVKKEITAVVKVEKTTIDKEPLSVEHKSSPSLGGDDLSKEYIELVKKTLGNS